jgi:hypothetical protein
MDARAGIGALLALTVVAAGWLVIARVEAKPAANIDFVPKPLPDPESLAWHDVIVDGGGKLMLSDRAKRLSGRRVRMAGFMAKLELPPKGGFYLTAQPVQGDESGAGTGDLPLDSVLVLSRSVTDRAIETTLGPVEVKGTLDVGNREDSEGRPNWLRLTLDSVP